MPNLTTALPRRTGDAERDYENLYNWAVSLTDELKSLLCNLDAGNVSEAASIKAQNIDVGQAKIKDGQITSLTADKLTAGVINAGEITIESEGKNGGNMHLTGEQFEIRAKNGSVFIGADKGKMKFALQNYDGTQGVYMNDDGRVYMTGDISTNEDCLIQGNLRVGMQSDNKDKGIEFYGMSYNASGSAWCARIIPYMPSDADHPVGINILTSTEQGDVYIDGKRVLTTDDLQ